jgi:predicted RNase H-like nuclease
MAAERASVPVSNAESLFRSNSAFREHKVVGSSLSARRGAHGWSGSSQHVLIPFSAVQSEMTNGSATSETVAGADGCPAGWVVASEVGGRLSAWLASRIQDLVGPLPEGAVLAIDIPIGIPTRHDRTCCKEARRFLGKRRNSVFTVPVRACSSSASYEEASALHRQADGQGISKQAWGILDKIGEVDAYQLTVSVVVVGIVGLQDPQTIFDRESWGDDDKEPSREGLAGRAANRIEGLPCDQHRHDSRLTGSGCALQRKPVQLRIRIAIRACEMFQHDLRRS